MKALFWVLIFLATFCTVKAQRLCGTVEYVQQLLKTNPSLQNSYNRIQLQTSGLVYRPNNSAAKDTIPGQIINIPVVIHLLYNTGDQNITDAQIISQLNVLNRDYRRQNGDTFNTPAAFKPFAADAKIMFCLAQIDPKGNRTSGIIRKYTSQGLFVADDAMKFSAQGGDDAWDCTKYLNIWVCNLISRSLGYATPPGGEPDRDGVVIGFNVFGNVGTLRAPFDKGRTATHEIGHWLGLRHTWGDQDCGDDSVYDTPKQESYNYGCPSFPHVSACSPNANGDMFMNFMDFSDDGCMNLFTAGQAQVMRALFAKNSIRNSFLTTYQCDSTLVQAGPLPITAGSDTTVTAIIIKTYPNPVHTQFVIECSKITRLAEKTLRIYNVLGIKVFEAQLSQPKTTVNLSSLPSAIYIVRIGEGAEVFTTKIVRE